MRYGDALRHARSIVQRLIDLGLSAQRPLAIASDNDLEHLLLSLGAILAGVAYAPTSTPDALALTSAPTA